MARFLFVSLPLRGHLDWGGMLNTAATLAHRGHVVAWASGLAAQSAVADAGVPLIALNATGWRDQPPLPAGLPAAQHDLLRRQRGLDAWLSLDSVLPAYEELRRLVAAWQPDLIVAEPYVAAAALAAEATEVPLAVCGRPALPDQDGQTAAAAGQRVSQLCRQTAASGRYWDLTRGQMRSPLLHLDFFTRGWYADLPAVEPQTRFVGGLAAVARHTPLDPPAVLITLGSLFTQDVDFFRTAAEAVFLEGGQPLVVTGQPDATPDPAWVAGLPAGAEVRSWVDFPATLPRLAAIVHHGGVGTTHAALRHGLPQVAVPHAGDQHVQAGRITQAGVGFGVRPADFSLANARWLIRQALWDERLRTRCSAWRDELDRLGGAPAAADACEQATHRSSFVV